VFVTVDIGALLFGGVLCPRGLYTLCAGPQHLAGGLGRSFIPMILAPPPPPPPPLLNPLAAADIAEALELSRPKRYDAKKTKALTMRPLKPRRRPLIPTIHTAAVPEIVAPHSDTFSGRNEDEEDEEEDDEDDEDESPLSGSLWITPFTILGIAGGGAHSCLNSQFSFSLTLTKAAMRHNYFLYVSFCLGATKSVRGIVCASM